MKGNIHTGVKCSCGGTMKHIPEKHNCFCSACGMPASKGYTVNFGRAIRKRFKTYQEAAHFLSGIRYKTDEGTFDHRDYRSDNPLSFMKQSERWLTVKENEVSKDTHRKYTRFMRYACAEWKDRNVKSISYGDIEDFLYSGRFKSDKYRHDAKSCLNHFFDWLVKREKITKPGIPIIRFDLGWRNIIGLKTQKQIIEEVYRIAPQEKIAFGIELLATYTNLRPDDLRRISERDYRDGIIRFERPTKKKNRGKLVQLIDKHIETWERLKAQHPALPHMPFFRHHNQSGVANDSLYGKDLFYKWWKKACKNLGIEGVDLYGGTRHSSTTATAENLDEATAKQASEHDTSSAFGRYCQARNTAAVKAANMLMKKREETVQHLYNLKTKKETSN